MLCGKKKGVSDEGTLCAKKKGVCDEPNAVPFGMPHFQCTHI
jgi:hypothetical protein